MNFIAAAETDIGISKETNQDSVGIRIAETPDGQIIMAVLCDGMGGLSKGEVASAAVVQSFCAWFENEFPSIYKRANWTQLAESWEKMLKQLNIKIMKFGKKFEENIGTTVTAVLMMKNKYMVAHVGDSRFYKISSGRNIRQITQDQTLVQQEIARGRLTPEEAKEDPRKSILLQCVGASKTVRPEMRFGKIENKCIYMLCSDGFRHKADEEEISQMFSPSALPDKEAMHDNAHEFIERVKRRQEKDNISVVLIRAEET